MRVLSVFSGIAGFDKGFSDEGFEVAAHSEIDQFCCEVYHHHFPRSKCLGDITKLSVGASRVKTSRSRESAVASTQSDQHTSFTLHGLSEKLNQLGLSSRMFPDFFLPTVTEICESSCVPLPKSGVVMGDDTASAIGFWTVDTSESPKDAAECSLSEVLEQQVPSRYFLSPKACAGILRRSERRGVELPEQLKSALERVSGFNPSDNTSGGGSGSSLKERDYKDATDLIISKTIQGKGGGGRMNADENLLVSPTLRDGGRSHAHRAGDSSDNTPITVAPTLNGSGAGTDRTASAGNEAQFCIPIQNPRNDGGRHEGKGFRKEEISFTQGAQDVHGVATEIGVRRLTPRECERLQGFPDDWTKIREGQKDSPRYRALGNAVTVTVPRWIARRIKNVMNK